MNKTSLTQQSGMKKKEQIVTSLKKAFKGFDYSVYLFGSYAIEQIHRCSDVDIPIISPDVLSTEVHRQACDRMTELSMNYDILISSSLDRLDESIINSLQTISTTAPSGALGHYSRCDATPSILGVIPPAFMLSHNSFQQHQTSVSPFMVSAVKLSRGQFGMTLIEIMVALLIGAFLLGGVLQVFVSSKQTNRMQENLSRLQENGRFALDFISKDIRRTGYWGCLNPSSPDADIAGTNDNAANGDNIDDGTDTLTLRGAFVQTPVGTCGGRADTTAVYYTDPSSTITYKINSSVLQQDTNNQNNSLIEGIEDMQILYGVDTDSTPDGTPNYYVSVNNVTNMAQVISIRISLLAVTFDDNLAAQPLTYTYNGVTTTSADRRIRRVFNSTVAVRNRLP